MTTVKLGLPTRDRLEFLANNLCVADLNEIMGMSAMGPWAALKLSVLMSHESYVGLVDDRPVCAFGLGIGDQIGGLARPWLLGTDEMKVLPVSFARRNRAMVRHWSTRFPVLQNYVSAENTRSIRWLNWLGFKVFPMEPFGPFGWRFHRFEMKSASAL